MSRNATEHLQGECLLLADTAVDATMIEVGMRSQGHAIRVIVAPGVDTLLAMLNDGLYLALIIDVRFPNLRLRDLLRDLRRAGHQVGTLVWQDDFDGTRLREALDAGADGLMSRSDSQLSLMLLERVMRTGSMRRQLQQLRERVGEQARKDAQDLEQWDGPVLVLQEGIVTSCNQRAADLISGGNPDQLIAMPVLDLLSSESVPSLRDAMRRTRKNGTGIDLQLLWQPGDDDPVSLPMTLQLAGGDDSTHLELRGQSSSDDAPDAAARERLRKWLAESNAPKGMHSMLVLVGLDDVRRIEDEVGVFGLDELRTRVGRLLLASPLADAHLAPLDGGILALACTANSLEEMQEWVSARLRQISRQIFTVGTKELSSTASATITPLAKAPRDPGNTLISASQALLQVLESPGTSRIQVSGDAAAELQRREESERWSAQIRQALAEGRFALAYQNVACLIDDEHEYADVLMRMNDPSGEAVPAREFMPAAQEHGLMVEIDRWVVQAAISRLRELHQAGKSQVFFVRLDITSVQRHKEFLTWLDSVLGESPLPQGALVMVLRERMLQTQLRSGMTLLSGLRERGLATAVDHFGISSQSAELLRRLPLDYVKLHSDFTSAVSDAAADIAAFREIMEVAKQLKIRTIAERVASANAMARLWQMGVNFLMGSHVHEPAAELDKSRFRIR